MALAWETFRLVVDESVWNARQPLWPKWTRGGVWPKSTVAFPIGCPSLKELDILLFITSRVELSSLKRRLFLSLSSKKKKEHRHGFLRQRLFCRAPRGALFWIFQSKVEIGKTSPVVDTMSSSSSIAEPFLVAIRVCLATIFSKASVHC
jgi:hypothetical protein